MPRGARPGERRGGRAKGTPNKLSRTVKDNVIAVFDQIGGESGMVQWAKENRTEFYRLWGKLIPHDLQHSGEVAMRHVNELSDNELADIASGSRK